jgi:hypothetical protein
MGREATPLTREDALLSGPGDAAFLLAEGAKGRPTSHNRQGDDERDEQDRQTNQVEGNAGGVEPP